MGVQVWTDYFRLERSTWIRFQSTEENNFWSHSWGPPCSHSYSNLKVCRKLGNKLVCPVTILTVTCRVSDLLGQPLLFFHKPRVSQDLVLVIQPQIGQATQLASQLSSAVSPFQPLSPNSSLLIKSRSVSMPGDCWGPARGVLPLRRTPNK